MTGLFSSIIGHHAVVAFLGDELARPAHAYLFVGPSGIGKATVALEFAAGLLARGDETALRRVRSGAHPDLVTIEPEGRTSITVDQARSTVSQASLAPMVAERKIFLVAEASTMNEGAANALLKTLEEPSRSSLFILVADAEGDLPMTIASRARTVVFGRVADEDIVSGLIARGVDEEQAVRATRISGGRPGLALRLATQPEVAEFRRTWLTVPTRLSEHPGDAYRIADEVIASTAPLLAALQEHQAEERNAAGTEHASTRAFRDRQERDLKRATASLYTAGLEILAGFYRDAAAAQYGATVRNPDIAPTALTSLPPAVAVAHAERVLETVEALEANQRPQLAFASLFADLGGRVE